MQVQVGTLLKYRDFDEYDFGIVVRKDCEQYSIYWVNDGEVTDYNRKEQREVVEELLEVICK